jgi:hypothetical protein
LWAVLCLAPLEERHCGCNGAAAEGKKQIYRDAACAYESLSGRGVISPKRRGSGTLSAFSSWR